MSRIRSAIVLLVAISSGALAQTATSVIFGTVTDSTGAAVPNVPVVATCDLHSLLTETMLEHADAIVWFKTYPHVDMADRAIEAVHLLARAVRGEVRPTVGHRRLPLAGLPTPDDRPVRGRM